MLKVIQIRRLQKEKNTHTRKKRKENKQTEIVAYENFEVTQMADIKVNKKFVHTYACTNVEYATLKHKVNKANR